MVLEYGNSPVYAEWIVDEKVPPGYVRVYLIHGGEVVYEDSTTTKKLVIGEAYVFPSASTFKITHNPKNPIRCTFVHLDLLPIAITELIELKISENEILYHVMQGMRCAVEQKNTSLVSGICDVLETYLKEMELIVPPLLNISAVLAYISEHLNEQVTLQQLSEIAGYNQHYLIRLFKKTMKVSPYQYITNQRLKLSIQYLRDGLSVSEVSAKLGYSDLKTFSRAFKDKFGVAPSHFLKKANFFS